MSWRSRLGSVPWVFVLIILFAIARSAGMVSDRGIVDFYKAIGCLILLAVAVSIPISILKWRKRERKCAEYLRVQAEETARAKIIAKEIYSRYEMAPRLLNDPSFLVEFHKYWGWRRIREVFVAEQVEKGRLLCAACGKNSKIRVHVDHIKPRSRYPELRYLKTNLQILCDKCNIHKSDYDGDDWVKVIESRKKIFKKNKREKNAKNKPKENL